MTVAELLDRISAEELAAWQVFHERIEPIGERRADLRAGVIAATVANAAPAPEGTKREQYRPEDFALQFDQGPGSAPADDMARKFRALENLTRGDKR